MNMEFNIKYIKYDMYKKKYISVFFFICKLKGLICKMFLLIILLFYFFKDLINKNI